MFELFPRMARYHLCSWGAARDRGMKAWAQGRDLSNLLKGFRGDGRDRAVKVWGQGRDLSSLL